MPEATIRTVIVEDEAPARAAMRVLLEDDPEVEVVGETWGARAIEDIGLAKPDLIFLDVRMPRLDGFQLLERLDPEHVPVVVFVTAYEEYAVDAFEVRAVDYVLKPFTDDRFRDAVARAKKQVRSRDGDLVALRSQLMRLVGRAWADARPPAATSTPDRIVLEDGGATIVLPPARITWLEASGPYVVVHAEGREHLVRTSLKSLEERLADRGFVRVHRSAAVNIEHVREVRPLSHGDGVIVLRDGTRVKLSRSRREAFESILKGTRSTAVT